MLVRDGMHLSQRDNIFIENVIFYATIHTVMKKKLTFVEINIQNYGAINDRLWKSYRRI